MVMMAQCSESHRRNGGSNGDATLSTRRNHAEERKLILLEMRQTKEYVHEGV